MSSPPDRVTFSVAYSGTNHSFSLPPTAPLSDLHLLLSSHFHVPPNSQTLIHKGRKLPRDDPSTPLASLLPAGSAKLLLIGPREDVVQATAREEDERRRKHEAFEYHRGKGTYKVRSTVEPGVDDGRWSFGEIRPFPEDVPQIGKRRKMLERLAADPAVKDVMVRHKFEVGILTELHPILQSNLLGLNKNGGQEVCLRLLTNDLEGTRAYLDVRRVLLHELSHNVFGPHDDNFKTLNSLLNKEVAEYEAKEGIRNGAEQLPEWNPEHDAEAAEVDVGRTLSELDLGPAKRREVLKFGLEEEVDARRERMRRAAEERRRREEGTGA